VMDDGCACCEVKFESCVPKCCGRRIYDKLPPLSLLRGVLHRSSRIVCSSCILLLSMRLRRGRAWPFLDNVPTHLPFFSACLIVCYIFCAQINVTEHLSNRVSRKAKKYTREIARVFDLLLCLSSNKEFAAKRFG
jgi:hypothetical protein